MDSLLMNVLLSWYIPSFPLQTGVEIQELQFSYLVSLRSFLFFICIVIL